MIEWKVVILAFFVGMTIVFLLESRGRSRRFDWRYGFGFAGGTAVIGTLILLQIINWQATKNTNPVNKSTLPAASFVADSVVEDTAVSPLPPPSIFVFTRTVQHETPTPIPQPATLSIPDLDIAATIVDVPLQDGSWDVSNLEEHVGRLAGVGQHPGDALAMVFAGHMTFPSSRNLLQGAFANLQYAIYDTQLFLDINNQRLTYEVVEISRVEPDDVQRLVVEDGNSILLVTCTDWDENGRVYANRLLIRAERVESNEG